MNKPKMSFYTAASIWTVVLCFAIGGPAFSAEGDITRRLGIFIGSNNGGVDRTMLRYAVSDARAVSKVFSDMGGIIPEDNMLLVEPTIGEINKRIDQLQEQVLRFKQSYKRTEIVFYYSGHSDEEGLLLNRERYRYRELRERINSIPSDMRIVILDSCSSGSFTRAKGGAKTQPFLIDSAASAEGYAFLTSSSASEVSQESDRIESSYFTHSLVAGLRGAADMVGDGRVTLNEAYRFAYNETMAKTETSVFGVQHPSYDMQVNGAGDLVLTDIKEISASLVIDETVSGRLSIRDQSDYLIVEITKTAGKPIELGLESGLYRITLQQGNSFFTLEIRLEQGKRTPIRQSDFVPITAQARGRTRGNDTEDNGESAYEPISIQLVPSLGIPASGPADSNTVLFGILGAQGKGLHGTGFGSLWISNSGRVEGAQMAGLFTHAGKDVEGVQMAGVFTHTNENLEGVQAASVSNITEGDMEGIQAAGIFNITDKSMQGIQAAGIFNQTKGDYLAGVQAAGVFNYAPGNPDGVRAAEFFYGARGGVQAAGVFNLIDKDLSGVQAAGIFNYAGGDRLGVQAAGIFNYTGGNLSGAQMALVNIARENTLGAQLGLVNIGGDGAGVQVGLVNVSENEKVVPIGLVNVVKNGMMHSQVFYDDMGFINLGFKSGSKHVYSVFNLGVQKEGITSTATMEGIGESGFAYHSSFGLGFEFPWKHGFFDIDMLIGNIGAWDDPDSLWSTVTSSIAQLRLTAGFKAFEHLGIFAGLSYDYIYWDAAGSPKPGTSIGDFVYGWGDDQNMHKLGFFAGIQF